MISARTDKTCNEILLPLLLLLHTVWTTVAQYGDGLSILIFPGELLLTMARPARVLTCSQDSWKEAIRDNIPIVTSNITADIRGTRSKRYELKAGYFLLSNYFVRKIDPCRIIKEKHCNLNDAIAKTIYSYYIKKTIVL